MPPRQIPLVRAFVQGCTVDEVKYVVRLIKHDLRCGLAGLRAMSLWGLHLLYFFPSSINARASVLLPALDPSAMDAFRVRHDGATRGGGLATRSRPRPRSCTQATHNLRDVVTRLEQHWAAGGGGGGLAGQNGGGALARQLSVRATLNTPVKPMLCRAAKDFAEVMAACPNGALAEIKVA